MIKTTKLPIPTVTIAVQIVINAAMQKISTDRICLANSTLLPSSIRTLANNAMKTGNAVPSSAARGSSLRIFHSSPGGSTRPEIFFKNVMAIQYAVCTSAASTDRYPCSRFRRRLVRAELMQKKGPFAGPSFAFGTRPNEWCLLGLFHIPETVAAALRRLVEQSAKLTAFFAVQGLFHSSPGCEIGVAVYKQEDLGVTNDRSTN